MYKIILSIHCKYAINKVIQFLKESYLTFIKFGTKIGKYTIKLLVEENCY